MTRSASRNAYLGLCYFVVMVRELEVGTSCVDVHPRTKNITMVKSSIHKTPHNIQSYHHHE